MTLRTHPVLSRDAVARWRQPRVLRLVLARVLITSGKSLAVLATQRPGWRSRARTRIAGQSLSIIADPPLLRFDDARGPELRLGCVFLRVCGQTRACGVCVADSRAIGDRLGRGEHERTPVVGAPCFVAGRACRASSRSTQMIAFISWRSETEDSADPSAACTGTEAKRGTG